MKKYRWVVLVIALVLSFTVEGTKTEAAVVKKPNTPYLVLPVGRKYQVKIKKGQKATYKVNNKKIVTVTSSGKLVGRKKGKAILSVLTSNKKKEKITIFVGGTKAKKVNLLTSAMTMVKGETATLKASYKPAKVSVKKLEWTSTDSKVVTVANGNVEAISAGEVTITAKTLDGSNKKATCKITVTMAVSPL